MRSTRWEMKKSKDPMTETEKKQPMFRRELGNVTVMAA